MLPVPMMSTLAALLACAFSLSPGNVSTLTASRRGSQTDSVAPAQTQTAAVKINRLRPSAFPELPARIVRELERRGCTIPQVTIEGVDTNKPHNVASGEFTRKGQKDWAALCSRRGRSAIHIFWGRPTKCASVIEARADSADRFIGTADAKYILDHYEAYGGPKPPPLTHEGINDGIAEKASAVLYCYGGKWRTLQGAD